MKNLKTRIFIGFSIISATFFFQSCSSVDDPTANLPVCDCVELEPQRDANGKRIDNRGHIMYLKDSLYTGKCIAYHLDNTTKKVELIFQKGLLNGVQQVWDDKGNLILEAPMSQGRFHGTLKEWNDKQQLVSKMNIKGGAVVDNGFYEIKDNEFHIFYTNKSLEFGFPYISWFEDNSNFAAKFATSVYLTGEINISYFSYDKYYSLKISSWDEVKPQINGFKEILQEFHKNNPDKTIIIEDCSIEGSRLRGPDLYYGKGLKELPIPTESIEFCKSLENYKFINLSNNLKTLLGNAKTA